MTQFKKDLAELGKEVRTKPLRPKRSGPLPVPEFKATRAWLDVAPLYMKWRVGEGERGGREGTKRATGGGKRARREGCSRRTQM